jgi:VanZ family protein
LGSGYLVAGVASTAVNSIGRESSLERRGETLAGRPEKLAEQTSPCPYTHRVKKRLLRTGLWLIAVAVLVALVGLSLTPQPPGPQGWDKVAHATAYALFVQSVLLAAVWAPRLGAGRWPNSHVLIVVGAVCLGASLEILQDAYFARTADVLDEVANVLGALVGAFAWYGTRRASVRISLPGDWDSYSGPADC